MAENKKSFVVYSDWNGMFKALPDEVAGKLIKHILSYVNDENPTSDDFVINALFEQIKATLKRDLKKWEKAVEQRSKAGLASAEARAKKVNDRSTESNDRSNSLNETQRKPTVSDNVSVSVNDNESKEGKKKSKLFIPPALFELVEYFKENGFSESLAERAFKYYDVAEWKDSKGNQVKNWKQKMQSVWFKDENKSNPTNPVKQYNVAFVFRSGGYEQKVCTEEEIEAYLKRYPAASVSHKTERSAV
jgi:hypothetical protein